MDDVATRSSWKAQPFPETRGALAYSRRFDRDEQTRIQRGLVPQQMEDKWFIFSEAPWLYFHRSWTGICIYAVRLRDEGDGCASVQEAWVNRDATQYKVTDDAHDAKVLSFLVERLLLGLPAALPLPKDLDPAKASAFMQNVVGHGRANDEKSG
jgi:hypothetical protein